MVRRIFALALASLIVLSASAYAVDTPKTTWLKAKCAVCHGESGDGKTPEGIRRNAPDLRVDPTQKMTDKDLARAIDEGHSKMPSFKVQLTTEQVWQLVFYIRSVAKR